MTISRSAPLAALAALPLAVASSPARADDVADAAPAIAIAQRIARDAGFTPTILRPGDTSRGLVLASTGWNGARDRASVDVNGEVGIWGPIRIVARVDDVTRDTARPGAGVGVHFLDEARHGVASTAYLLYKTEGFTEPEGELEAVVSFGRALGPVRGVVSLAYGQDPEGNERDGEVALAAHVEPTPGLFAGVTGRYRDALGSRGEAGVLRDLVAGATATWVVDRFAATGVVGIAGIDTDTTSMTTGLAATLSVGAAF